MNFFAAFFYPKDLKAAEEAFNKASEENGALKPSVLFDMIHKTLYCFSNNNLHGIFQNSVAFRVLLKISLSKKREIFNIFGEAAEEGISNEEEKHMDDDNEDSLELSECSAFEDDAMMEPQAASSSSLNRTGGASKRPRKGASSPP